MFATARPSGPLKYTTMEEIQRTRRGISINLWEFGHEEVTSTVYVMVPLSWNEA